LDNILFNERGNVLEKVRYDPSQTTIDSEVTKVASAKPDFVMMVSYPETGSTILRTAYEMGILQTTHWLLAEGLMADNLATLGGKDKDGKYILAGQEGIAPDTSAGGAAYQAFQEKYLKEIGKEPTLFCANGYDAMAVASLAIEQAKNLFGKAIAENLMLVANPPERRCLTLVKP
jgi:branched-chain amino acid transport system substrate-binding protein/neutral amino acid transport system substrate-binding protein